MGEHVLRISFTELKMIRVTQDDGTILEASVETIAELPRDTPSGRLKVPDQVYVALVDLARSLRTLERAKPECIDFTIDGQK